MVSRGFGERTLQATRFSSCRSNVYQQTLHDGRRLTNRRTVMEQQNKPNQPQQGNKPGQPNQMPNKPGQGTQQSTGGQQDQSANKK